jgi:hypothetical protein
MSSHTQLKLLILTLSVSTAWAETTSSRGSPCIAVGAGTGSRVRVFAADTGQVRTDFFAFDPAFKGGVRVAMGDVNNDGRDEIVVAAGPRGDGTHVGPLVRVFDGKTGMALPGPLGSFHAYDASFQGGVFVAVGDVNGDGRADIITGAGEGGSPVVSVWNGLDGRLLNSFYASAPSFTGGVRVAAGDVDGDGRAEIITGAGAGALPAVQVFRGDTGQLVKSFLAYPSDFKGGVFVGTCDMDGKGQVQILTGAGAGGGPHVKIWQNYNPVLSFFPFSPYFTGGVTVAGSGRAVYSGAGPTGAPHVVGTDAKAASPLRGPTGSFYAFDLNYTGGVWVAAGCN